VGAGGGAGGLLRWMDDEALALCLQEEEELSLHGTANPLGCLGLPARPAATGVSAQRVSGGTEPELLDEELAVILQREEEEAAGRRAPGPSASHRPSQAAACLPSVTTVLRSGGFLGCCGGLQLASCLGCGHIATWLCALGGGIAGHMTTGRAGTLAPGSRLRESEGDDDFYPDDSDDEPPSRGLDPSAIEGHTVGHVYVPPASPRRRQQGFAGDAGSEEDSQCMVCMEGFANGDQLRTLPCLHRYHRQCIDEWLSRSPECPICKHDITAAVLLAGSPVQAQPKRLPRMRRLWHRSG